MTCRSISISSAQTKIKKLGSDGDFNPIGIKVTRSGDITNLNIALPNDDYFSVGTQDNSILFVERPNIILIQDQNDKGIYDKGVVFNLTLFTIDPDKDESIAVSYMFDGGQEIKLEQPIALNENHNCTTILTIFHPIKHHQKQDNPDIQCNR